MKSCDFFILFFVVLSVILSGISLFNRDEKGEICARYALWFLIFAVVNIAFKVLPDRRSNDA